MDKIKTKHELSRLISKSDIRKIHLFDNVSKDQNRFIQKEINRLLKDNRETTIIIVQGRLQ